MCGHFGVPGIIISGEVAACAEARALLPGIETVEVMVGEKRGSTRGMALNEMIRCNVTAIHLSPHRSRQMIREAAQRYLQNIDVVDAVATGSGRPTRPTKIFFGRKTCTTWVSVAPAFGNRLSTSPSLQFHIGDGLAVCFDGALVFLGHLGDPFVA